MLLCGPQHGPHSLQGESLQSQWQEEQRSEHLLVLRLLQSKRLQERQWPEQHDAKGTHQGRNELASVPNEGSAPGGNELEPFSHLIVVLLALDEVSETRGLVARRDDGVVTYSSTLLIDGELCELEDGHKLDVGLPQVEGDEPEGEDLTHGEVQQVVLLVEDFGVDLDVDLGAEDAIPLVDEVDKGTRIDSSKEWQVYAREGRHPTKGVDEVGIRGEIVVQDGLLVVSTALAKRDDDALDFANWVVHCRM